MKFTAARAIARSRQVTLALALAAGLSSTLLAGCGSHASPLAVSLRSTATRAQDTSFDEARTAITNKFTFQHTQSTIVGSLTTVSKLQNLTFPPVLQATVVEFRATQILTSTSRNLETGETSSSTSTLAVHGTWSAQSGVVVD